MPGLLFQGPRRIEIDPPTLSDLLHSRSIDKDLSLEPPLSPLTPGGKHKACRPSLSQASWIHSFKELENGDQSKTNISSSRSSGGAGDQCVANSNGEGDHDLAAMVHEFIEDGSRDRDEGDGDGADGAPPGSLCDSLKVLGSSKSGVEVELVAKVSAVLLAMSEEGMACYGDPGSDCKGACVRQLVAKHLKSQGYDAAICKLRWPISGNVPGGDYEYVDVVFDSGGQAEDRRLILDLDFQSQFEIARPTPSYRAALKLLPVVFVGSVKKLHRVLEIMSEAAKQSLTQNSMHLPPWRTIEYMFAKWLSSPHERIRGSSKVVPLATPDPSFKPAAAPGAAPRQAWRFCCTENSSSKGSSKGGCCDQLRRIKEGLRAAAVEVDEALPPRRRSSSHRDREVRVHGYRRSASTAPGFQNW
ncbi:uncharacterized protein LOC9640268 [Selaginella moellendorffii]|uniref:uncharacterized protein LOC9640268 n=1 Tax=Selaginella moellendorffii TaxID=88036 RepID=UPI000D1CCE20|nr:uncharacterized protein LOC9640268 [Selaginella moellendorffii]|eukprot:XP_002971742.2 uncharacterized protein LOC9640268 [Selaginella moellendorffii]